MTNKPLEQCSTLQIFKAIDIILVWLLEHGIWPQMSLSLGLSFHSFMSLDKLPEL